MQRSVDVVVIGAGHNGLVASFYLASAGLSVLVLEARDVVGGLCATAEIFPGVRGNLCANSAHNLEAKVQAEMQLERHGLRWSEPLQPNSFIMFPDAERIVSWRDREMLRAEYDRFAPGELDAHEATLDAMSELGKVLDVSFFDAPPTFASMASTPMTAAQQDVFRRVMFGSAADVVEQHLRSEQARTSLGMLAAAGNFIGPATPGSAYQLMQRALYRGASAVRDRPKVKVTADFNERSAIGGMGAITAAMASAATAAGATIRTSTSVASITADDSGVTGVVLASGEIVHTRTVVSAANPKLTMIDLLDPTHLPDGTLDQWREIPMDGCMGKVYLHLSALPRFACAKDDAENELLVRCGFRIAASVDDMQRSFELARRGDWSGAPVIYGLTQTSFDRTLAPEGQHLMSLSVSYAPYHVDGGWESQADPWARHVITHLREHVTNLDDILVDYRVVSPLDLEQEFSLLGGNALHGDVVPQRMFSWRPVPGHSDYTTPVRGLYLCSNGTWPATYVSGLPGHNAAHRIIDDLRASRAPMSRS